MFSDRLKGIGSGWDVGQDGTPRTRRWSRKLANKDLSCYQTSAQLPIIKIKISSMILE
jgi:hypothetical protein